MRKPRMTEEEYLQTKLRIEHLKQEISKLRDEKEKLANKVRWYEYSREKFTPKDYTKSIAFLMFGKRLKDLTDEERRQYNRERTRIFRKKEDTA